MSSTPCTCAAKQLSHSNTAALNNAHLTSSFEDLLEVLWPTSSFRNMAYWLLKNPHDTFCPKFCRFCRFGCWNVQFTRVLSIYFANNFAGLVVGMYSLPACCPSTLPRIFLSGKQTGGLTKRFAGNFAKILSHRQSAGDMRRVVCQWFFPQLFQQKPCV